LNPFNPIGSYLLSKKRPLTSASCINVNRIPETLTNKEILYKNMLRAKFKQGLKDEKTFK
jgi:hypothetical protein